MVGVSHAQLNILHRIVGYTAVLLLALHAIFYTIHFHRYGKLASLLKPEDLAGIGAAIGMIILFLGILRHRNYELFYISHIAGFAAAVILTGLHRPNWAKRIPALMSFAFGLWLLDRTIRASRMLYNLINNSVVFYPLPDGGTRLLLKKPGLQAASPGTHIFLWIPRVHIYENHPFTIVNNGPSGLELVMKSHQGFTKAVNKFATGHPCSTAWASVDGPYGVCPNMDNYDKLIFIAGGSGAAFTFGLMNRILGQSERPKLQSVEFVWTVRRTGESYCTHFFSVHSPDAAIDHLKWFSEHLSNLMKMGPAVRVSLFVTNEEATSSSIATPYDIAHDVESQLLSGNRTPGYGAVSSADTDSLLARTNGHEVEQAYNLHFRRMDTESVIGDAIQFVESRQRVLMATCGPESLMEAVRDSAESWRKRRDLRIDVHSEDF